MKSGQDYSDEKLTIEQARQQINEQDDIILKAFLKRMEAAKEIARNKEEQGLPTYVPEREKEILISVREKTPVELQDYSQALFEKLMELSRKYQREKKKYGLLGRKLGHSFSPEIHKMIGELSQPYSYDLFQIEPEDLGAFITQGEWDGLNLSLIHI